VAPRPTIGVRIQPVEWKQAYRNHRKYKEEENDLPPGSNPIGANEGTIKGGTGRGLRDGQSSLIDHNF